MTRPTAWNIAPTGGAYRKEMHRTRGVPAKSRWNALPDNEGRAEMNIHDLMTKDVELIDPGTTLREAAERMRDQDIGAIPVGENDRLVGMVTDRDIVTRGVASDRPPGECTVREVMSDGIYYCFEDEDAHRANDVMAEHKVRRLPVLNRDKRLVGIVAMADLARDGAVEDALRKVSESMPDPRA